MDQAFSNIFKNSFLLGDALGQAHSLLENEDYFKIRCFKLDFFDKKRWALREAWPKQSDGREILKIAVGSNFSFKNWGHLQTFIKIPCTLEFLDPHFFMGEMSPREFSTKCNYLRGKIVLTTNHDFTASTSQPLINLINFYLKCTQSLFAGWDWDNHHNINISSIYAMCSDIYFPSQRGYDYELSRVAPNIRFIMPSAYEWPNDFLESNIDTIVNTERRINIFGAFNYYGKFSHRNRIIKTLNQQLPEIRFIDNFQNYQKKGDIEKLLEWSSAKWHWLVPTFNAVSVRAFYALIAGTGIILPIEFKGYEEFREIDPFDVIWFDERDVLKPERINRIAKLKFQEGGGKAGILRRHNFAKARHNLDSRVNQMVDIIRAQVYDS